MVWKWSLVAAAIGCAPVCVLAQVADPPPAEPEKADTSAATEKTPGKTPAKTPDEDQPDIIIKARKASVSNKMDRRVYDVSASPDAAFSTATDVLTRIPSVTVDPRGRIALRGDPGVKILVDGVEPRPGLLGSLQASDIERVEVVTNPSAQFSSDGSGGVINLILRKKRKDGLNGGASARRDDDGRYNVNANISYKTGRWTLSANAGFSRSYEVTTTDGLQQWDLGAGQETTVGHGLSTSSRRQAYENFSAIYDASDRDRFELSRNQYRWRTSTDDAGTVRITDASAQVIEDHAEDVFGSEGGGGGGWTLNYTRKGKMEGERFDLNLSRWDGETEDTSWHALSRNIPVLPAIGYGYFGGLSYAGTTLKGDYERPVGKARLNTGFQLDSSESESLRRSENIATIVPGEGDATYGFAQDGRTIAGYITWQAPVGRWGVMPGLRLEAADWTAGGSQHDELRLLPSLHLNRNLSDKAKLTASYSRRTARPEEWYLNPRRVYWSRFYAFEGNPDLKTQYTDAYEAGYEYVDKDFSANSSLYYRVNTDPVAETRRIGVDQLIIQTMTNADQSRAAGFEVSAKGRLSKKLDYSVNLNVFNKALSGLVGGEMLTRQALTWSGNTVVEYKPNTRDWFQFNLSGEGESVGLQGYTTGFYRLDMTYRHKLTPKLTLAVRAIDLLNSSKQTIVFATPEGESRTLSRKQGPSAMIGLGIKFGRSEP